MTPKISFHAVQRYLERIKKVETEAKILGKEEYENLSQELQTLFSESAYVSPRYFFHAKLNVVFVVYRGVLVTIYEGRKASEYEQKPRPTQ